VVFLQMGQQVNGYRYGPAFYGGFLPDTDSSRSGGCRLMENEFTKAEGHLKVKMVRMTTN
jgi:hypothetical protein